MNCKFVMSAMISTHGEVTSGDHGTAILNGEVKIHDATYLLHDQANALSDEDQQELKHLIVTQVLDWAAKKMLSEIKGERQPLDLSLKNLLSGGDDDDKGPVN